MPQTNAELSYILEAHHRRIDQSRPIKSNISKIILKPNNCNDALARIVRAYNIEEEQRAKLEKRKAVLLPHLTNHSLRHTYCTRMIERCIGEDSQLNIKIVQYLMGHRDAKTTLNIYAHVHEEYVKNTMSKFAGQIYLG